MKLHLPPGHSSPSPTSTSIPETPLSLELTQVVGGQAPEWGQCLPGPCWRSNEVGPWNCPKGLCTPVFHHSLQRLPSQYGRPETWRGEGYASNSRGGQGAGTEDRPWSVEHLRLRFSGSRGPSCSSEGLKPSEAHVTGHCVTFACTFPSPLPCTPKVSTAIQATWLDSSEALSVPSLCWLSAPSSRTVGTSAIPLLHKNLLGAWRQHPKQTGHGLLFTRTITSDPYGSSVGHILLLLLLLFPLYRRGNRLRENKCLVQGHTTQNFNVYPFRPCLFQIKGSLTSIPLTAMRVSFAFSSMCQDERHCLLSRKGQKLKIETFSWEIEKVGLIRLQECPETWWDELGVQ